MTKEELLAIMKQGVEDLDAAAISARDRNDYPEMWYRQGAKESLEMAIELVEELTDDNHS